MARVKYLDCDCGFCDAIFDNKDDALDYAFRLRLRDRNGYGVGWGYDYTVAKIKAGYVVYSR